MLETLLDTIGDDQVLALVGALVGLLFGAAAQHSRFCLRAATAEVAELRPGPRLGVWLIVFACALIATQAAAGLGWLDYQEARQIAGLGSLSGAIVGGAMFGVGMVLARGCASRLLVLSATGNMRALVSGMVLTLVAQASLRGVLAPAREAIFGLWTIPGGTTRDLMAVFGLGRGAVLLVSLSLLALGLWFTRANRIPWSQIAAAFGVGLAIALGWLGTYAVSQVSFEPVALSSVTFTGPSTDTLMALVNTRELSLSFGLGLVPGVFVGSGAMALATAEFRLERFDTSTGMERYLIGASFMGFGAMLAGGCAVGAGVSGGAIMALTAWVAVFAMWVSALIATRALAPRPLQNTGSATSTQ